MIPLPPIFLQIHPATVVSGSTEAPGTTDNKATKQPPGGELTEEDSRPQGKPTTKQQQQVKVREVHHATPPTAKQGRSIKSSSYILCMTVLNYIIK